MAGIIPKKYQRRYSTEYSMVSAVVWSSVSRGLAVRIPTTVISAPLAKASAIAFWMLLRTFFSCPAPKYWETITEAPEDMATKKFTSSVIMGEAPPTAARACLPTKRPTISVSAILYSCWSSVPSMIGRKNSSISFQMTPSVIRSRVAVFCDICDTPLSGQKTLVLPQSPPVRRTFKQSQSAAQMGGAFEIL